MNRPSFAAGAICLSLMAGSAQGAVLVAFEETGGDVVGTLSGALDLGVASPLGTVPGIGSFLGPAGGILVLGSGIGMDAYAVNGPTSFGGGETTLASAAAGGPFSIIGDAGLVLLPGGYAGEALSGSVTFADATFAELGVARGDYVWSLPNDTVTLRFGETAVIPLPASLPLMLGALGLALPLARRRG